MIKNILSLCLVIALSTSIQAARYSRYNAYDIVYDTITNLTWQDDSVVRDGDQQRQDEAIKYCLALTHGGYTDWVLPNINELNSISDRNRYNPSIDPIFEYIATGSSYLSSTYVDKYGMFSIEFYSGGIMSSNLGHVRCVRLAD